MIIVVISDYEKINNKIQLKVKLFEYELTYFHIRKRNYSYAQLYDYINSIPKEFHKLYIIDEHLELAVELGLKGFILPNKIQ